MNKNKTTTVDFLINTIKQLDFKDVKIKTIFFERQIEYYFKQCWGVFDNDYVCWKDIIKYSLGSEYYKAYQLGKLFKSSPNGIYDFIDSGVSFYGLPYSENIYYLTEQSQHGIIVLNIASETIYCYYKINMGGCDTCGLGMIYGKPDEATLYMSEDIESIVKYCMSEVERECSKSYIKGYLKFPFDN